MPASRQPHRKLGELTDFALDRDRTAVLLRYDVVADRQAKSRALAGRLGGEEGLERLLPVFRRNTDAVVAHPNLDGVSQILRPDLQDRPERAVSLAAALVSGIEAIADEV